MARTGEKNLKRYIFNSDIAVNGTLKFDVVIIGSGLAGLYTAMHIDEHLSCAILTKGGIDISNTWLAQGGIAAAISEDDNPELHFEDTLVAGGGINDPEAVRVLVNEGPSAIKTLTEWSVPFDTDTFGDLEIGQEGGHRRRRIVHAGGDATGRETAKVLAALCARRSNITFLQHAFFVDIITDERQVAGALIYDGGYKLIATKNVCICTGGIGQVYSYSTNPQVATGDGVAASLRAGARARDIEFIQFHPTGLYGADKYDRSFLISEAVRGDGGILRDNDGNAFMQGRHPMADLAPRDIVSREVLRVMKEQNCDHVWLDASSMTEEFFAKRFPTIYAECRRRGINVPSEYIPVCPVQHYMVGGIEADLYGMTRVRGLYVCGEAASTGVHGANRLASNSMLECLVFGRRAAMRINVTTDGTEDKEISLPETAARTGEPFDASAVKQEIKHIMDEYGGIIRSEKGLTTGLEKMNAICSRLDDAPMTTKQHMEALNMCTVAREILVAALARKESVGTHYREN